MNDYRNPNSDHEQDSNHNRGESRSCHPPPLTPPNCDTSRLPYMPVDVHQMFKSEVWHLTTGDEFKASFKLMGESWLQIPAASLPNDDRMLASLVGVTPAKWQKLKARALIGWIPCCDGRLYQSQISSRALKAWIGKLEAELRSARGNAKQGKRHRPAEFIQREIEIAEAYLAKLLASEGAPSDNVGLPNGFPNGDLAGHDGDTKQQQELQRERPVQAIAPLPHGLAASRPVDWALRLSRLCEGYTTALWADRDDAVWVADLQWFELQGFEFEGHVLPGCRRAFQALLRRGETDRIWNLLRVLHHQRVIAEVFALRDGAKPNRARLQILMEEMRAFAERGRVITA